MDAVTQIYLLLICQGFYLGSVGQSWTFPEEVTALIGSCVEIPCTYDAKKLRSSSPVWYLYAKRGYPEILNTKDSSSVLEEYRSRTSLVPGEKSCTLRIDPVGEEDGSKYYYPGIAEDRKINAYDKQSKYVNFQVTDTPNIPRIYVSGIMTEGEATIIRCIADHTCRSNPPTLQWNRDGQVTKKSGENSGGSWREESQLTYIPSYVDDGSGIRCTAAYHIGQITERSITLHIFYAPKKVTITDIKMEGSDVTLQCNSRSNPDVSEYEWYKGKEKSRLPYTGREITVRNVTWNMKPYSCTAINSVGKGESALTEIPVLFAPKEVTLSIIGMDKVMEGSDVTLQCNSVSKFEVYEYEWYKGEEKSRLPDIGQKIRVKNVTWDVEPYSCAAINPMGRGESALTEIPVLYGPKNVTVTVIGMDEVMEGSDVTLQCNSFSKPDVYKYEWYKGKEKSKLSYTGREITVRNVTWNMEPYSCTAINHVGRGESALTELPVLYAATGVHITVRNNHEFTALICNFLSSRPDVPYYTWRKDGSTLHNETGKTLTLYNNEESYGQYLCIAHNRAGDSSSEEIHVKRVDMNLPVILGTVAGVFFLFFFILVIYFCLRQKKKSTLPNSPIHGTVPARIPNEYSMTKDENQYGNIQNTRQAPSMRSGPSVDMKFEDNYVIYSNSEALQPSNEVAYSVISHRQHEQERLTSSRAKHAEDVEYAALRH